MYAVFRSAKCQQIFQSLSIISKVLAIEQKRWYDVKGKIGIVTGGADGIGFATVKALLKNGAKAIVIGDIKGGQQALDQISKEFGADKAIFVRTNVTDPPQLKGLFQAALSKWNKFDIVVNNAGILGDAEWENEIRTNVIAVVRGTYLGMDYMSKDKGGQGGIVVNLSSVFGMKPFSGEPVYVGTKHFLVGFDRSIGDSNNYKRTGVKVLTLCPGMVVRTENAANGMIKIIKDGESGSIWISEGDEPVYEVVIPPYVKKK